jgi:hypothetical protein
MTGSVKPAHPKNINYITAAVATDQERVLLCAVPISQQHSSVKSVDAVC